MARGGSDDDGIERRVRRPPDVAIAPSDGDAIVAERFQPRRGRVRQRFDNFDSIVARVDPNGEDAVFESFGTDSWIRYLDEENDNLVISTDLSFSVHRLPTVMTALKTMESRKSPEHSKLHYDPLRPVRRRLDLG